MSYDYERFVEIPGVVEVKWVSDNPDYYIAPVDLFDEQSKGIPDWYGKKDKATTEQAFFTCLPCDCDLKSVVTLRAHCRGTQHIRKALQAKREYNKNKKKAAAAHEEPAARPSFTLPEELENTREHIVGLEFITELERGQDEPRYYHCSLPQCEEEQGGARSMATHLVTLRHRQGWLMEVQGEYLETMQAVMQALARLGSNTSRDYRKINTIQDPSLWRKARDGSFRWRDLRENERRSGYKRERGDEERRDSYPSDRDSAHQRHLDRSPSRRASNNHYNERVEERLDGDRRRREANSPDRSVVNDRNFERSLSHRKSNSRYDERVDERMNGVRREAHSRDRERNTNCFDGRERSPVKREFRHQTESGESSSNPTNFVPKRERDSCETEVEEVSRSGNFSNWRTGTIKIDRSHDQSSENRNTSSETPFPAVSNSTNYSSVTEDVARLHKRVAAKVMGALDRYYPGSGDYMGEPKISSPEEYSRMAKHFSHKLRASFKESYEAYNNSLEGIRLTPDFEQIIKTDIDSHFESIPVLRSLTRV